MRRRRFDPVAVSLRNVAEFIADGRLRGSLPRLDWRLVETHQGHGGVYEEMLPQVERFESGSKENRRRFESACRQHHSGCDNPDRPSLTLGIGIVALDTGDFSFALHELRHRERRYDPRSRANRIQQIRRRRALLPADSASEHAVPALGSVATERIARDHAPAIAE